MSNPNQVKGAITERMVASYFRANGFWMADRRLREGRTDDQGDLDGVPYTTVQVKYVEQQRYSKWVLETIKQRDTAGTPLCLLVRRVPRKSVEEWEALMPPGLFIADFEYTDGSQVEGRESLDESEAWTWLRMDLRLAVVVLKRTVGLFRAMNDPALSWDPYSATTQTDGTGRPPETGTPSSAPSMEKGTPPSPTT